MQKWIGKELKTADIGDKRLNGRYEILLDRLSQKPSVSIPAACNGWSETMAAYRFFDNNRIDEKVIFQPHQDATLERIKQHDVVLLAQDTTELDLTRPEQNMKDAGPLNDEKHLGFHSHVMLALTPDRFPIGVVHNYIWARDMEEFLENKKDKKEKEKKKKQKPIEEKESYRWVEGYERACEIASQVPSSQIVVVSDSESDIFECFLASLTKDEEKKAEWIIRACQDRSLSSKTPDGTWAKLWQTLSSTKVLETIEIKVSKNIPQSKDDRKRKQPRSARETSVTIQATTVELKGPNRPGGKLSNISVNAVLVKEIEPPPGEPPIEWLLLTSLPISKLDDVLVIIRYYCCRWQIEIFFRILKSGCTVEKLQLETAARFKPCLALYMVVAWRVMYCLMLGRNCPELSCDLVFADEEWKAVYMVVRNNPPPEQAPKLGDMIAMIASLGGYLGRKHDGPPGPKTMWIGMQRMADLALAWSTFVPPTRL